MSVWSSKCSTSAAAKGKKVSQLEWAASSTAEFQPSSTNMRLEKKKKKTQSEPGLFSRHIYESMGILSILKQVISRPFPVLATSLVRSAMPDIRPRRLGMKPGVRLGCIYTSLFTLYYSFLSSFYSSMILSRYHVLHTFRLQNRWRDAKRGCRIISRGHREAHSATRNTFCVRSFFFFLGFILLVFRSHCHLCRNCCALLGIRLAHAALCGCGVDVCGTVPMPDWEGQEMSSLRDEEVLSRLRVGLPLKTALHCRGYRCSFLEIAPGRWTCLHSMSPSGCLACGGSCFLGKESWSIYSALTIPLDCDKVLRLKFC